jgi:hypothetical protein
MTFWAALEELGLEPSEPQAEKKLPSWCEIPVVAESLRSDCRWSSWVYCVEEYEAAPFWVRYCWST